MKIILASGSPRRKELLESITNDFIIDVSKVEEKIPAHLPLFLVPENIAKCKALDVYQRHQDDFILAADTVVIASKTILGKPKDKDDVIRMIKLLEGKAHFVVTGVCLIYQGKIKKYHVITKVYFRKMSDIEIEKYSELTTVYDKAGAYAIQGEAGKFIYKIKGEYENVVGLPLIKLRKILNKYNKRVS